MRTIVVLGLALLLVGATGLTTARSSRAHVVVSRATLRQHLQHADHVVSAEFLEDRRTARFGAAGRQDVQRIRIEEVLDSGRAPAVSAASPIAGAEIEIFFHAEGAPAYRRGDRALLFLQATAGHREVAAWADALPWVSLQSPGEEWRLEGAAGQLVLGQARDWLAWQARSASDDEGFGALVATGLRSGVESLEADAVAELLRWSAAHEGRIPAATVDALAGIVSESALDARRRVVVLRAIEPALGTRASDLWSQLLEGRRSADETVELARLLAGIDDPTVGRWLRARLAASDPGVRRAAWRGFERRARPGNLAELATGSLDPDPVVARAAIRGLGRLESADARRALSRVAVGDDPERARWAAAALRRAIPAR